MTSHVLRLWVIGSYEMPRCDWLQHCNFLAGIEILPIALQTVCKPCGFAARRPAIVAGPVLRVAIGESCSVCRALYRKGKNNNSDFTRHQQSLRRNRRLTCVTLSIAGFNLKAVGVCWAQTIHRKCFLFCQRCHHLGTQANWESVRYETFT